MGSLTPPADRNCWSTEAPAVTMDRHLPPSKGPGGRFRQKQGFHRSTNSNSPHGQERDREEVLRRWCVRSRDGRIRNRKL